MIHNGIMENFHALRQELNDDGVTFKSDTGTEVVVHLPRRRLDVFVSRSGETADTLACLGYASQRGESYMLFRCS